MSSKIELFKELTQPFPANDIEWRVQRSGEKNGKPWAMVIPYVTNRGVQNRLDEVFGPLGWKSEEKQVHGGWMCGISVYCSDRKEWVTKWDGADNITMTDDKKQKYESVKAGISASMKRAAVQWGIGRYLYSLEATFADIPVQGNGKNRAKVRPRNGGQDIHFSWNPPRLPEWALPEEEKNQNQSQAADYNREEYLANRRNQQVQQQQQNGHVTETPENAYRKRKKQQQQQQQPQNAKQQYFKGVADDVKARKEAELAEQQQVMVGAHDYYESKRNGRYGNKQSGQVVVNQRAIETPDSFEAPRQPVITPQQFKRLQGALQMAHLDEVQFCTIAGNIRTLGELTQDRFDGAMARVQKEAQRMAH